jgi:serine/threonine-protein kinase
LGDRYWGEERFKREGRLLAKLAHPNIARLVDAGVTAAGQPYLMLEYVEGTRIDTYCEAHELSVRDRLKIFLEVLAAVAHAHANLIVHRDIKPSNIYLTPDRSVKLLDFGIAKLLEDDTQPASHSDLTVEGSRPLTPGYAAPEQVLGAEITVATDIYGLGVLLYVLLTGRSPFGERHDSTLERFRAIVEVEPRRLSEAAVTELARRVLRGDLDNIAAKALQKDPLDRYPSVTAFAEDVRRYLHHEPVSARPDRLWYRAHKFMVRNRVAVSAAVLILVTILGSLAFAVTQMFEARAQRDQASYEVKRATAMNRFLSLLFSQVGPAGRPLAMSELLDRGVAMLETQYGEDPEFIIDMLIQLSGRYMDAGDSARELEILQRAESIARSVDNPELIARVQCNTVETELSLGEVERAQARMLDAEQQLAKMTRPAPSMLQTDCMRERAYLARAQGDFARAIALQKQSLELMERAGRSDTVDYASTLSYISSLYSENGDGKQALAWNQHAEQATIASGRGDTMGRIIILQNRMTTLVAAGEIARAAQLGSEITQRIAATPQSQGIEPRFRVKVGRILARLGREQEALQMLIPATEELEGMQARPWIATAFFALGVTRLQLEQFDQARTHFGAAEAIWNSNPPANRRWFGLLTENRARIAAATGHAEEASRMMQQLLAQLHYPQQTTETGLRSALLTAATLELHASSFVQAEALAIDALKLAEHAALDTERSADVGEALLVLGRARLGRNDVADGRAPLQRSVRCLTNGLGATHRLTRAAEQQLAGLR